MSRILVVDDEANVLAGFQKLLATRGHEMVSAGSADAAFALLEDKQPQAVVLDICMPGMNGLDALERIKQGRARLPVIIMTGQGTMETAIEATKRGAFDYQLKPFKPPEMLAAIERALQAARAMEREVTLDPATVPPGADAIVGQSPAMQAVYKAIGRVAATDATVLIRGESGTGKELVARAIYQHSRRADRAYYIVNCVAIPEALLESELFGFERGAFTGAYDQRIGKLEQAHGGTVLLDEIGDVSGAIQAKLLRVLQEKTLQRIGANETIRADVRVLAATNRDLEQAIADGEFREDLFHRLNVVTIWLPPLRERRDDLEKLTRFFLQRFARELRMPEPLLTEDAMALIRAHHWPGNVRELEHCIHRAMIFTAGHPIGVDDIRSALAGQGYGQPARLDATDQTIRQLAQRFLSESKSAQAYDELMGKLERGLIQEALDLAEGNLSKAAKLLGMPRATLFDKAQRHGLRAADPAP
ncbi:MAG TPA: sigma-54 dependent transcriptional regulator [Pirellulales bacterium]|nr:sigma-54 dependent transcriptional regulator [Pirellulales bacterium]